MVGQKARGATIQQRVEGSAGMGRGMLSGERYCAFDSFLHEATLSARLGFCLSVKVV
jgi:hypothetical protein